MIFRVEWVLVPKKKSCGTVRTAEELLCIVVRVCDAFAAESVLLC